MKQLVLKKEKKFVCITEFQKLNVQKVVFWRAAARIKIEFQTSPL